MGYWEDKRVLVTGGAGFLGSFVIEELRRRGADKIFAPSHEDADLTDRDACRSVVAGQDIVIHLAALVGGIGKNRAKPGDMFFGNIMMGTMLMEEARLAGVAKYVAAGTVCAYPKIAPIPFREDDFWVGYPEETNAPYGLAKKMQLVQAQAYRQQYGFNAIYLVPSNLYGPGDNIDEASSHVIPAIITKSLAAQKAGLNTITLWGTGQVSRDFLFVEDAARGIVLAAEKYEKGDPVNLGSGKDTSINELAELIFAVTGYNGDVVWDTAKPDGRLRGMLDVSRADREFGFTAKTSLEDGLRRTVDWYRGLV